MPPTDGSRSGVEAANPARPLGYSQAFFERASGAEVGRRSTEAAWDRRGAMNLVHDAHYTLLAGTWGCWAMGIVALAWLIGIGVGAYLTLPLRPPFWRKWRRMWRSARKAPRRGCYSTSTDRAGCGCSRR